MPISLHELCVATSTAWCIGIRTDATAWNVNDDEALIFVGRKQHVQARF